MNHHDKIKQTFTIVTSKTVQLNKSSSMFAKERLTKNTAGVQSELKDFGGNEII